MEERNQSHAIKNGGAKENGAGNENRFDVIIVRCSSCGSSTTFDPHYMSGNCPYCNSKLDFSHGMPDSIIKPHSILPFSVDADSAKKIFNVWVKSRNFVPGEFEYTGGNSLEIAGIYLPYWMFDGEIDYEGAKKKGFNSSTLKALKIAKINGRIGAELNNILICGSDSLPLRALSLTEPGAADFRANKDEQFLRGFITEKYVFNLKNGLLAKKDLIDEESTSLIRGEIFWNQQKKYILSRLSGDLAPDIYIPQSDVNYRLMLLPLWHGAYKFKGVAYYFIINGRTGKIFGQRPYSKLKSASLLASIILILSLIFGSVLF